MQRNSSDRFTIRDLTPFDAEWLFKITGDPEAVRYMGVKQHTSVREAGELIATYATSPSRFVAVVDVSAPGELLGVIGFEQQGHSVTMALKFNLHDRRARGAGRLVGAPFARVLLQRPAIRRVWCYCHRDNVPVHRVLAKSGWQFEGIMRKYAVFPNISDEPQECWLYAITR